MTKIQNQLSLKYFYWFYLWFPISSLLLELNKVNKTNSGVIVVVYYVKICIYFSITTRYINFYLSLFLLHNGVKSDLEIKEQTIKTYVYRKPDRSTR